jgi:hypothetical protein
MSENELAYGELLVRYKRMGFWSVYHAMLDDGYDPKCDYLTMLGALKIADATQLERGEGGAK